MSPRHWLTVVGIGEDGLAGIGAEARAAIGTAEFVFGGRRHLALAREAIRGEARTWPTPFDTAMKDVLALSGRKVCVLASGDPFCHGVGTTLSRLVPPGALRAIPAPSAFSLAASRLGWALQETETISLHGKPIARLLPLLHPGARILALTSDGKAPAEIAALIHQNGFGPSRLTVLEALGGEDERVRAVTAGDFALKDIGALNLLAIEVAAGPTARILTLASGLDDDLFEHDGQITKREIRAATLSALAPRRGQHLWDIGAGSGSIAIEWLLAHPSLTATAIEARADRAARIRRNAAACGVPDLAIVQGEAPAALAGLPAPDAVFVGGGGSEPGVLDAAITALKPGGRLVANAVTLQMEAVMLAFRARLGGDLTRIAVSRATPVGSMDGWRAAMPVTQWVWVKP